MTTDPTRYEYDPRLPASFDDPYALPVECREVEEWKRMRGNPPHCHAPAVVADRAIAALCALVNKAYVDRNYYLKGCMEANSRTRDAEENFIGAINKAERQERRAEQAEAARDAALRSLSNESVRLGEAEAQLAAVTERIIQCHTYPLTVEAQDEGGNVGPHVIDGVDASEVSAVIHGSELPPVYGPYRPADQLAAVTGERDEFKRLWTILITAVEDGIPKIERIVSSKRAPTP